MVSFASLTLTGTSSSISMAPPSAGAEDLDAATLFEREDGKEERRWVKKRRDQKNWYAKAYESPDNSREICIPTDERKSTLGQRVSTSERQEPERLTKRPRQHLRRAIFDWVEQIRDWCCECREQKDRWAFLFTSSRNPGMNSRLYWCPDSESCSIRR